MVRTRLGFLTVLTCLTMLLTFLDLCVDISVSSALPSAQWPMFKNISTRTGRTKFDGPDLDNLLWVTKVPSVGVQSGMAISIMGIVYAGDDRGYLYAFNADGSIRWSLYLDNSRVTSSPAIGKDRTIYVVTEGGNNGTLHAVTPNGTLKWEFQLHAYAGPSTSPAIARDGTILVGTKTFYAINPDGTQKWSYPLNSFVEGPCAISDDGTIYFPCGYYLYALNSNGTLKWKLKINSYYSVGGAPAIGASGTIYVNTYLGELWAINSEGTVKWSYTTEGIVNDVPPSPAIGSDETIYFGGGGKYSGRGGYFYAVASDGTLKWKFFAGNEQSAATVDKNGMIYFCNGSGGTLYALSSNGTLVWSHIFLTQYLLRTEPVISYNGRLYVGLLGYFVEGGIAAFE